MPAKDPEKRRATMRAWYARTKHLRGDADAARRKRNRESHLRKIKEWHSALKSRLQCNRCGESHPGCLQFHHADPGLKETSIAEAVRRGWGIKSLSLEVDKCEVLCANCHAKHHEEHGDA